MRVYINSYSTGDLILTISKLIFSAYGKLTQNKEKQFNVKFGFGCDDSSILRSKHLLNVNILNCESDSSHCYEYLMRKRQYIDNVPGKQNNNFLMHK